MKRIIALLVMLCSWCSFAFANEQEARSSFEAMAGGIIRDLQTSYSRGDYAVVYFDDVYFDDGTSGGWLKMGYDSLQAGMAVYPTKNAEAPYVGTLQLANRTIYYCSPVNTYGEFKNRADAEAAMNLAEEGHPNFYRYLYVYKAGQWCFAGEQIHTYAENGDEVWADTDDAWDPYKRMLIQNRWQGFDGSVEHY